MNWKQFSIIVLLFVLIFGALPVSAQPQSPEPLTDTGGIIVVPGDDGQLPPYQFLGMLVLIVLAYVYSAYERHSDRKLHLEAIDRLYHSVPPFVRQPGYEFVVGTGSNVLDTLDRLSQITTWTDLDDRGVAAWKRTLDEMKGRWQELVEGKIPPPETVPEGSLDDSTK